MLSFQWVGCVRRVGGGGKTERENKVMGYAHLASSSPRSTQVLMRYRQHSKHSDDYFSSLYLQFLQQDMISASFTTFLPFSIPELPFCALA